MRRGSVFDNESPDGIDDGVNREEILVGIGSDVNMGLDVRRSWLAFKDGKPAGRSFTWRYFDTI